MSRISHLATSITIQLLSTAIKFRKAGLISLLAFFLINCYFMLFDQQAYIAFLEHYISPDGHISDINSVFLKVQVSTILMAIVWFIIDQPSIDLIKEKALLDDSNLPWRQRPLPYIIICCVWLLISYTPFLFLDSKTIIGLIQEDGFFQNCGAIFLFAASVIFFYLFYKSKEKKHLTKFKKGRNIWFLLLGLLFLFGAGEEISWGQRIFDFKTPDFMSSNIQGEFTIHNLPWFDGRSEKPYYDKHGLQVEKGNTGFIALHITSASLSYYFCALSLVIFPLTYIISGKARNIADRLRLPIPPAYFGIFFIIGFNVRNAIGGHYAAMNTYAKLIKDWDAAKITHLLNWGATELYETFMSLLFMLVAIWFVNHYKHQDD